MSAEKLRRAAKVLRERAAEATPGPWWNDASLHNVIFAGTGSDDDVAVTEDFDKKADADYIATMHPGVGLAIADWLDDAAMWMSIPRSVNHDGKAGEIADLILGGDRS